MNVSKEQKRHGIIAIIIFLLALVLTVINQVVNPEFFGLPVMNFFAIIAFGFAILSLIIGVRKKSPAYIFLGVLLISLVIFYIIMAIDLKLWWIALISVITVCSVFAIISLITVGNKTEDIALNDSPDYKNYEQRKAEKEEKEMSEKEEIPEIKSYK